jgi:hypothetical protein
MTAALAAYEQARLAQANALLTFALTTPDTRDRTRALAAIRQATAAREAAWRRYEHCAHERLAAERADDDVEVAG